MSTRRDRDQLSLLPDEEDESAVITPSAGTIEFKSVSTGKVAMRANLRVTSVRIARMPATNLVASLRWLLTPKAYSRIVAPLIAQEQHEYYEALLRHDRWLTRWIEARMYLLILWNTLWAFIAPLLAGVFRGVDG